jgi:hypothetical protein
MSELSEEEQQRRLQKILNQKKKTVPRRSLEWLRLTHS